MPMNPRLLRPTASGFNPKSIAGLVGWFDASQIVAADLDGNGNVQTWRNLGSGGNATNGTANNRPTPTANGLNGRQVLTFDGQNDRLGWSADTLSSASIFLIHRANVPASGTFATMSVLHSGNNAAQQGLIRNIIKNDNSSSAIRFDVGGTSAGVTRFDYTYLNADYGSGNGINYGPTVLSLLWSPGGMLGRENGVQVGTATTPGSFQPAFFGATNFVAGLEHLNGYIAEILIYTPRVSAAQVTAVERYLGRKWGITVA